MRILPVTFISKHFKYIIGVLSFLLCIMLPIYIWVVVNSPEDYLQDELVRIMYIHVPSAWLGLGIYAWIAMLSALYIIYKNPQYHILALSLAPVGLIYTVIALITGSIWGKPAWGTWWVWDARLTSMLLLAFIYLGYITIASHNIRSEKISVVSSYYSVIGAIIIPIIKFSVDLWATLHQPSSVFKINGATIHYNILIILFISLTLHLLFALLVASINVRAYWLKIKNT